MIHLGELSLEERGAMEIMHSAMQYISDRYAVGGFDTKAHREAYNVLPDKVTEIRVQAAKRRPGQ
jgi:hypothetical protein